MMVANTKNILLGTVGILVNNASLDLDSVCIIIRRTADNVAHSKFHSRTCVLNHSVGVDRFVNDEAS